MTASQLAQVPGSVVIETRFGTFSFDRDRSISFPKGILGFGRYHEFGLVQLEHATAQRLLLLHSIEPSDLAFIVTPYEAKDRLIDAADVLAVSEQLGIRAEDRAVMLIATLHRGGDKLSLSVNLRAPLFVDSRRLLGWQYVLPNDRYEIRYMI
jgi:flagellar assembly factor FliW